MKINNIYNQFVNSGSTRSVKAKKNILISFLIKGISIVTGLLMVPLTISYVDQSQYGIWLTLSSVIAWFSFFDIGFGNGLRNKFAESKASGNDFLVKAYVSTTYGILTMIFIVVWIIFFLVNYKLNWSSILNASVELKNELSFVAIIVFSFFCIQIVLNTISTILFADQKPAKAALIATSGQVISLIIIYILTLTTNGSLIYLAWAIGIGPFVVLLVSSLWFFNSSYKIYSPSVKLVNFRYAKGIMSLGAKFFVIQIAAVVVYQTTNIIIAQVSGPEDVTVYNIAFKYFSIVTMVFSIIMTPFWSAFTEAKSTNDYIWMRKAYRNLFKIVLSLMVFTIFMLLISNYVFNIWVGTLVSVSFSMSLVVALFVMINLWNMLFSQLLNGMGKIKLQLYMSLIGTTVNIPLAVFLGKEYGVVGVVISSIILSLISAVYGPYQINLLLNKKAKGIWNA
jgi:O-antigen/teichoic acid export membrane protein